jgi:Sap-like sulfolipid-1-addressing protein
VAVTAGPGADRRVEALDGYPRVLDGGTVGQAIGQALPFAVAIALSPIPIVGVVLMLATPAGPVEGMGFLAGWVIALAAGGTVLLFAASGGDASEAGSPAEWVSIVKLLLGALLLRVAVRQWRGRPRGDAQPELPAWMKGIDSFTPAKAAGMGALLAVVNPKNLLLLVGGAAAIAQTGAGAGDQAIALAVFIVIATLGVAAPIAIKFLMGERAAELLGQLHDWLARENATIMAVICLLIGVKLIGDAISALSA